MAAIAVVNAGSSSIKFAAYEAAEPPILRVRGLVEGIGATPRATLAGPHGEALIEEELSAEDFDHAAATRAMMRIAAPWLEGGDLAMVGHRVVHGGGVFTSPLRVTEAIVEKLSEFIPLAPLHQPHNLAVIVALLAEHPKLCQFACFDTAFHASQPPIAQAFAIPRRYSQAGVRRYGFHGISYQYISSIFAEIEPALAKGRVIVAHLGSGASLCAISNGGSVASTMGFTTAEGLVMGTRCGAIDPGVLVHMIDHYGFNARDLEDLIFHKSGLLGVSGISADMRTLRASPEPAAKEAIALFVYRIVREIGSLVAALGGLDAIIFTGGIGENDPKTRAEVVAGCAWLGVALDEAANRARCEKISGAESAVAVYVISTNEELEIARSAWRLAPL